MNIKDDEIILGGKALPILEQIKYLKGKGCKYFESYTSYNYITNYNAKELNEVLKDINMYCVHSPMFIKDLDIALGKSSIEVNKLNLEVMKTTLDYCDAFSNVENPIIVIHLGLPSNMSYGDVLENSKYSLEQLYDIKDYIAKKNYKINVAIENSPIICSQNSVLMESGVRTYGAKLDPVYLIDKIKDKSIGTCLDLCHAQSDIEFFSRLNLETMNLNQYIDCYKDSIKLVHFNNCVNLGFGNDHSQTYLGYEDKHYEIVKYLLNKNYNKVPWTLEVFENQYVTEGSYGNYELARDMLIRDINKIKPNLNIIY